MNLTYSSLKDEDVFTITDFSCDSSQALLEKKDLFKIMWCKDQALDITIDDYEVSLQQNEVMFCTPLNVIKLRGDTKGLVTLVFNKEFFCIQTHDQQVSCHGFLFFGSSEPQRIMLDEREAKQFQLIYLMLREDLAIQDHLQGEMLRASLKRMLIMSTRIAKTNLPQPDISNAQMNIIREYNILVEKHFRELHHVKDYANLLFKSPKTLSNLFPKYSDKSPLMVIHERIVLEAKRLLLYSDKSTNEIGQELGYKDPAHFSKFFKKHEGLSPSNFRKNKQVGKN
jgi:YesN/AraC family two-component response regulator